jgi:hypothetical protein
LRRSPERFGRRLVLSLPEKKDTEREEGRRVFRIVEDRFPKRPGRLSFPAESKKSDPEIEVGPRVSRLPPDDFAE